jgi:endonuclease/exonuclease/phosphatase family metal-dependent hydrolase
MKKQTVVLIIALFSIAFFTAGSCEPQPEPNSIPTVQATTSGTIKILSWNLQIFGVSEANNPASMKTITDTMKNYDVIFIQEIRDASGTAFTKLCSEMPGYAGDVSSRAGRTNMKEQYGCLYKKDIKRIWSNEFTSDPRWERPPIIWAFEGNGYIFRVYVMHTKPEDTPNEIKNLESVVQNTGNVIVLGDLNADCNYYTNTGNDFKTWTWLIKDNIDTTTGATDRAYDRIIVNSDAYKEVISSGVVHPINCSTVSDHYPVYVEIADKEK